MRAVSDLGGLPAGPIDRTEHEPTPREKRIDAMKNLVQRADARLTSDCSRRAQEELAKDVYDGLAYYDRWLVSFRTNLLELGYIDEAELEERMARLRAERASK